MNISFFTLTLFNPALSDLYSNMDACQTTVSRMQTIADAEKSRRHCHVALCSAATNAGVDEAFDWLTSELATRLFSL